MSPVHYHATFPPNDIDWEKIIPFSSSAYTAIANYDRMLKLVPDQQFLLSPLLSHEAVVSSRIEGIQASMVEMLKYETQENDNTISENKRRDIVEVWCCIRAIDQAAQDLEQLAIGEELLRRAHEKLMHNARGGNKNPGKYRTIPVYIGPPGGMSRARYVPPDWKQVPELMDRWEKYINGTEKDGLIQTALLHAEFESIHPFADGNGRLGRMLVPLHLFKKGLISAPYFYISSYFEKHRDEYYARLQAVSEKNDWTGWCAFFLEALRRQAQENLGKTERIFKLYENLKNRMPEITRSKFSMPLVEAIFDKPMFQVSTLIKSPSLDSQSTYRLIKMLEKEGVLKTLEKSSGSRSALMVFPELLEVIGDGEDVF